MFAEIALLNTTLDTLTYSIPHQYLSLIKPGALVKVELKKKKTLGIVITQTNTSFVSQTKDILQILCPNFLPIDLINLFSWVKRYYYTNWGSLLNLTIPKSVYSFNQQKPQASTSLSPNDTIHMQHYPNTELDSLNKIVKSLISNQYQSFLLFKFQQQSLLDIYLTLIQQSLQLNKSIIILIPEIKQTPQYINVLQSKFNKYFFLYHSRLKLSERKQIWHTIKNRKSIIVCGTRSAIFAPVQNLGLIIVDNEHDPSYKEQERHFHYHARDIAVKRGQLNNSVVILSSATPSLESYYNTQTGKYQLIKTSNPGGPMRSNKSIRLINMCGSKNRVLSAQLIYEIQSAYRQTRSIVLYLNRLGFSRSLVCQDCGYLSTCPQCGIPFLLNQENQVLICNLCQTKTSAFDSCPQCKGNNFLYRGTGIQQVTKEIKKILPKAEIIHIASDVKINSLILTQDPTKIIITTKLGINQFNYTQLGLFGVISADTNLLLPDFRAGEKTFQELSKIISNCTTNKNCRIIIQTYHPDNFAIYRAIQQDYEKFYIQEINQRKKLAYPPFTRLVSISSTSHKDDLAQQFILQIMQKLNCYRNITVLGPLSYPEKFKRKRYQLLVKLRPNQSLANLLTYQDLMSHNVDIDINIDPI